jgi:hypothetical protein
MGTVLGEKVKPKMWMTTKSRIKRPEYGIVCEANEFLTTRVQTAYLDVLTARFSLKR